MSRAGWVLVAGTVLACGDPTTTKSDTDSATTSPDSTVEAPTCDAKSDAPACNACIEKSCCTEFTAFDGDPTDEASVDALSECLYERCPYACTWEICDSGALYPDLAIAQCMGGSCCETVTSCVDDAACWSCVTTEDAKACNAGKLDEAFLSCQNACQDGR